MIVTFTLPVLLSATGRWLLDPTVTLLKLMLVGLMPSCGFAAETPVPESKIVAGEPFALLAMVTPPVTLPGFCGPNCTENEAFCPGSRVSGTEIPLTLNPGPEGAT